MGDLEYTLKSLAIIVIVLAIFGASGTIFIYGGKQVAKTITEERSKKKK